MRSVDGWVREADPASTRRQVSLGRRMVALRKKRNNEHGGKEEESRPLRKAGGGTRDSSFGGGSTFLTELQTDGALPVPETDLSQGHGGMGTWVNGRDAPRRRNSLKANSARQHPRLGGGSKSSGTAQRQQARRRSSGVERGPSSTEVRTRRATESAKVPARSRSEDARVKVKVGRTKSLEALDRYSERQTSQRIISHSSVRGRAGERGPEGRVGQAPPPAPAPPQPQELSGQLNPGRIVMGNSANWTPSRPGGAWNSPSPGRTTDCDVALVRQPHAPCYCKHTA